MWQGMLTQSATIRRPALSSVDGAPTLVASGVSCWVQGGRGTPVSDRTGERVDMTWLAFFTVGTDIREADHVEVDSIKYEVLFVHPLGRHRAHHLEVDLKRMG